MSIASFCNDLHACMREIRVRIHRIIIIKHSCMRTTLMKHNFIVVFMESNITAATRSYSLLYTVLLKQFNFPTGESVVIDLTFLWN